MFVTGGQPIPQLAKSHSHACRGQYTADLPSRQTGKLTKQRLAGILAKTDQNEVTMEEFGHAAQLRAGELIIIVVVLIMWAGVIVLFCRQYDIIKDNEPNNNKDKAKNSSECSTPEHPQGGLLRSNV
ncbi:unnamed protein product [Pleuronectes platessa]|uniref:Fibronectin type III domain-containing protein n=1 Tax=Pleuronectes platessa TaxID=8262 RepID=A0A9N7YFF5_PLEPL|nr:unnamed protein product [Pleuronectes platessa]